jgi:hypothetical protein
MIPPFMPMTISRFADANIPTASAQPSSAAMAMSATRAAITSISSTARYRSCTVNTPLNQAWIAAAEKAAQWATSICATYTVDVCAAYGSYLNDCAGGDIVLRWYNGGVPIDVDVPRWLCDQGYPSPLYPKFYPIHGVRPPDGPLPEGAVKPTLYAVMVQYNDREPIFWPVSPVGCEPGHECTFQFFYPCEPLIPGKEPKIVEWPRKAEPGRIRPSGGVTSGDK